MDLFSDEKSKSQFSLVKNMKSYSRPGKKSKVHSKARVSNRLSDEQLLEKFSIRKCFVEIYPLKSDETGLSEISPSGSSLQKTENKSIAKNQLKKAYRKHRERDKQKHLDSKIIKNGTQTLHYETLEDTDHTPLPEKNQNAIDLSIKNKGRRYTDSSQHLPVRFSEHASENQEKEEESNTKEVDLARKRRTRSSSNSSTEIQNLESEVSLASHETDKEIKLTDRGKKRIKSTESFSHLSNETLNLVSGCSEAILVGHNQEEKDSQMQTRKQSKKKKKTSIDSKKVQNLDSECSEAVLSSHEQTEKSNLSEIDLSIKNRTRRSSNSSLENLNSNSECSKSILVGHKQEEKDGQRQIRKQSKSKNKKRTCIDSKKEVQNLNSECSEAVLSSFEETEESYLIETDLSIKNGTRSSSNSSRGTQNFNSEYSKELFLNDEQADGSSLVETQRKQKGNRSSSNSNEETLNVDSECSEIALDSHERTEKSSEIQIDKSKKNRILSNSSREMKNLDSESSEAVLSNHEQEVENNLTESDFPKKNESSSNTSSEIQNLASVFSEEIPPNHENLKKVSKTYARKSRREKSNRNSGTSIRETWNLDYKSSETILGNSEHAEESNLTESNLFRTRSSSDSNSVPQNFDSICSKTVIAGSKQTELTETDLSTKRIRSSSTSSSGSRNFVSECSDTALSYHEQAAESNLTEIDLSRKNKTKSSNSSFEPQNLDPVSPKEMLGDHEQSEKVSQTTTRRIRTRSPSNSNRGALNLDSETSKAVLSNHEQEVENNLTESDFPKKNESSSNTSSEIQNLASVFSEEIPPNHENLKKVSKTYARKSRREKSNRNSGTSIRETWNLDYKSSETILGNSEHAEESNLTESNLFRTRSSSDSNSVPQNFDSICSKTVIAGSKQTELTETDLSTKRIRSSSTSSSGSRNFISECSDTALSYHEQAAESNLTEIDLSRKNKTKNSNSSFEPQNLDPVSPKEMLGDHEQSEKVSQTTTRRIRTRSPSNSNRGALNLDSETSKNVPIIHEQADEISHLQTRNRKRNRSPSDSSRETRTLDSECSETILVNHMQEVESSLIETDLKKYRNRSSSSSSRDSENLVSECSEAILSITQLEEISQTSSTVRSNRTRSSSNSSEGTQGLSSEYSESILASSQTEIGSLMETNHLMTFSGKKISGSSSDCSRKIQNLDSEFSGKPDSTDVQSVVLKDQADLPMIKRARNSSSSSDCLLKVQNSHLEGKNDEQLVKTQKEKKNCINHVHTYAEKVNKKNPILPTQRTTRNLSKLSKNKILHSELAETHTDHMEKQKIGPIRQSKFLAKKRSRNNATQILHLEHAEEHLRHEKTQDIYLDSNLPANKKAKRSFSLDNTSQNSNSESSERHNEILLAPELSLDSNLSSKEGSKSPFSLISKVQSSDFSERQDEHMQTNESNETEDNLCMMKSKSTSDLESLEFSKKNGTENNLDESENLMASDSHIPEKIKTYCNFNERVNVSDSENSCGEDCTEDNAKQSFLATSFKLNGNCKISFSQNLKNGDFETELESEHIDLGYVTVKQSTSQNRTRTSSCSSNISNLLDSEILKSRDIEMNMEMQNDILKKQKCSNENNVTVLSTDGEETSMEIENLESGISVMDYAEKESEDQGTPSGMLGQLTDCENIVQSRSRTYSSSSNKDSDLNINDLESNDWEMHDLDIENPEISEEKSLFKKYGIKECSVVLTRTKPLTIHYGELLLKEIAGKVYRSAQGIRQVLRSYTSQFSSLSQEMLERKIIKWVKRWQALDKSMIIRQMLIEELIEERNHKTCYICRCRNWPKVRLERNEEAEFLSRKLMESKGINIEQKDGETDQFLDNESKQSDNVDTIQDTDSIHDDAFQSHDPEETQNLANSCPESKHSLKEGNELQDSNLDCKESHIGKQQLNLDSHHDSETQMIHNHEDDSNFVNSKPCTNLQMLQNQNPQDSNPILESNSSLCPLGRTCEKDCANSPSTAESEVDCIQFQHTDDSEPTDTTSVQKEVAYIESTTECNPMSPDRETTLSEEFFGDASEKKNISAANEEYVVVDDNSEKNCDDD